MTTNYLILSQTFPAAATLTASYTVPGATQTVVSSITVCNHSTTASDSIRISVSVNGAADATKQYIYGGSTGAGLAIGPNDSFVATLGITLGAGDIVRVYSVNGTCSFNVFGSQIT